MNSEIQYLGSIEIKNISSLTFIKTSAKVTSSENGLHCLLHIAGLFPKLYTGNDVITPVRRHVKFRHS